MGRALIVSAGASSNEYIAARLAEMGYARPVIVQAGPRPGAGCRTPTF